MKKNLSTHYVRNSRFHVHKQLINQSYLAQQVWLMVLDGAISDLCSIWSSMDLSEIRQRWKLHSRLYYIHVVFHLVRTSTFFNKDQT